jgi:hypothetical protein
MKQTEKVSLEARVLNAMTAIWCKCSEQAYRGAIKESGLPLHKIGDEVTEEDGGDCFSAVHYYVVTA